MNGDTIAAIATAVSNYGISIIRVSGDNAISIVNSIFYSKSKKKVLLNAKTHTIHYGYIYNKDEFVDEVMVSVMKAPKSYTMEDVVEINCHGGILVTNKVLETVIVNGARLAEPGEFTKRAFLNGRIDLTKAEAIMDLIEAKSEYGLKASENQLKGMIYDKIVELRSKIIYEIAFIESAIDDPEHISLDGYTDRLYSVVEELRKEVNKLLSESKNGKLIKEGINTVIVGKPNAGKSSLLNRMVGQEKAIVTNVAGTTRDILEESIQLNGICLNIIDTAGIHSTDDIVEKIGVKKAKEFANEADLIIYVVDSSLPLDEADDEIISLVKNKELIVLLNKSDLVNVVDEKQIKMRLSNSFNATNNNEVKLLDQRYSIIKTSTKDNTGLKEFENEIERLFFNGTITINDEIYITNMRQKEALYDTQNSLDLVKKSLDDDMPEDFYSIDLMNAYTSLGKIIGEDVGDDLVQEIFSKFCMGK